MELVFKGYQQNMRETDRSLQSRFSEQKGNVPNKYRKKAKGRNFNQTGQRISDMQVIIIEKVPNCDINFQKKWEKMYIQKFHTKYNRLNQNY